MKILSYVLTWDLIFYFYYKNNKSKPKEFWIYKLQNITNATPTANCTPTQTHKPFCSYPNLLHFMYIWKFIYTFMYALIWKLILWWEKNYLVKSSELWLEWKIIGRFVHYCFTVYMTTNISEASRFNNYKNKNLCDETVKHFLWQKFQIYRVMNKFHTNCKWIVRFLSNDNYEMLDFALSVKNVSMHCVVETFFKISTTLLSIGKDMQLFISFWQMSIQIQDGNRNSFNKLKYII